METNGGMEVNTDYIGRINQEPSGQSEESGRVFQKRKNLTCVLNHNVG